MHSVKLPRNLQVIPEKIQKLRDLIQTHKPHIIAIVESWLNERDTDGRILSYLNLTRYTPFRQDRKDGHNPGNSYGRTTTGLEDRRGGGILVFWKKPDDFDVTFKSESAEDYADNIMNFDLEYTFQCAYCSGWPRKKKYGFTVVYKPPRRRANEGK